MNESLIERMARAIEFELREDQAPGLPKRLAKAALACLADGVDEDACKHAFKLYNDNPAMRFEQAIRAYLQALKEQPAPIPFETNNQKLLDDM